MRPLFPLLLAACASPLDVLVVANGAFADDDGSVLLAGSARRTSDEGSWYFDPDARDWQVVFFEAGDDLAEPVEIARFAELDRGQGGAVMSAALWWLRSQRVVVALESHQPIVYDLGAGGRWALALPETERERLFALPEFDLRDYASPIAVAPSPDGRTVAVHYTAALLIDGSFGELAFYHAIAFFDIDGRFIAADDLAPFRGGGHQLRRQAPMPDPMYPTVEPPAHQRLRPVASHDVVTFVWEAAGEGVVFARSDLVDGEIVGQAAVRVDRRTATRQPVDLVPPVGLPAPGGPVSASGIYLLIDEPPDAPDAAGLTTFASERSRPWGSGPDVPVEELGWTW
jgi:hypothetical protein